jgi:hypothetical protein
MRHNLLRVPVLVTFLMLICGCSALFVESGERYGTLKTAALNASDMVFGKYPDGVSSSFTLEDLKGVLTESVSEGRYLKKHYEMLISSDYILGFMPEQNCYFLCVCLSDRNILIFCHRSCSDNPGRICSPKRSHGCQGSAKELHKKCITDGE